MGASYLFFSAKRCRQSSQVAGIGGEFGARFALLSDKLSLRLLSAPYPRPLAWTHPTRELILASTPGLKESRMADSMCNWHLVTARWQSHTRTSSRGAGPARNTSQMPRSPPGRSRRPWSFFQVSESHSMAHLASFCVELSHWTKGLLLPHQWISGSPLPSPFSRRTAFALESRQSPSISPLNA
jgi:hypothetical protein